MRLAMRDLQATSCLASLDAGKHWQHVCAAASLEDSLDLNLGLRHTSNGAY